MPVWIRTVKNPSPVLIQLGPWNRRTPSPSSTQMHTHLGVFFKSNYWCPLRWPVPARPPSSLAFREPHLFGEDFFFFFERHAPSCGTVNIRYINPICLMTLGHGEIKRQRKGLRDRWVERKKTKEREGKVLEVFSSRPLDRLRFAIFWFTSLLLTVHYPSPSPCDRWFSPSMASGLATEALPNPLPLI